MKNNDFKSRMVMQVHDELVFDAHESEIDTIKEMAVDKMQNAFQLEVPLKVDTGIGINWLEAH